MADYLKILLIDTDEQNDLSLFLYRSGFLTELARNENEAFQKIDYFYPDLIIVELSVNGINGREIVRRLRRDENWIPVIVISEINDEIECALALDEGADDFIIKPINKQELLARVKALFRRVDITGRLEPTPQQLVCDDLRLDKISHRVWLGTTEIRLTSKAVALLEYMMQHAGALLAREVLLDAVWGWNYVIGTRAVDTRIAELRRALNDNAGAPKYIESVKGEGYRFIGNVRSL